VHDRVAALGAQFGAVNGWERALWYARPEDDTSEASTQTWRRDGPWLRRVREECLAVRDAAGVLDLPGFSRFVLEGPGAEDWLAEQVTGRVPRPGRMGLGYFADEDGRIVTEMSILTLGEDRFLLITAAAAQWHDRDWLRSHMPEGLSLSDVTAQWSCQILTGPRSREILAWISSPSCPASSDSSSPAMSSTRRWRSRSNDSVRGASQGSWGASSYPTSAARSAASRFRTSHRHIVLR